MLGFLPRLHPSAREKTTAYARKTINAHLRRKEYTSALLLSSIYVNIRLRSRLTDYLSPTKKKWRKTHTVLRGLNVSGLLRYCKKFGILSKQQCSGLDKLRRKRNDVAHESKLWRNPTLEDVKQITEICLFARDFLNGTKSSRVESSRIKLTEPGKTII